MKKNESEFHDRRVHVRMSRGKKPRGVKWIKYVCTACGIRQIRVLCIRGQVPREQRTRCGYCRENARTFERAAK